MTRTVTVDRDSLDVIRGHLAEIRAMLRVGNDRGRVLAEGLLVADLAWLDTVLYTEPECSYCGAPVPEGYGVCEHCAADERWRTNAAFGDAFVVPF